MEDIKVLSAASMILSEDGKLRTMLSCEMSDGSTWQCNPDGTNWKKVGFSTDDLTRNFRERKGSQ